MHSCDHAGSVQQPRWTGTMAKEYPFKLDPFQSTSVACLVSLFCLKFVVGSTPACTEHWKFTTGKKGVCACGGAYVCWKNSCGRVSLHSAYFQHTIYSSALFIQCLAQLLDSLQVCHCYGLQGQSKGDLHVTTQGKQSACLACSQHLTWSYGKVSAGLSSEYCPMQHWLFAGTEQPEI